MDFDGYNIYIVYKMRYNITGGYILKYANFLYVACSAESTESTWHCTDVASLSRVTPRLLLLSSGKRLQLAIENHHVYPFLMDKSTINSYVSFGPSIEVNFFTEIDDEGDQIDDDHVSAAQKCPSIRRRRIDASCSAPEQEDSVFSTCSYTKMHSCRIQRYTKYH